MNMKSSSRTASRHAAFLKFEMDGAAIDALERSSEYVFAAVAELKRGILSPEMTYELQARARVIREAVMQLCARVPESVSRRDTPLRMRCMSGE
jgi:hypothetical protein